MPKWIKVDSLAKEEIGPNKKKQRLMILDYYK
jgi:hypothetical protein